MAVVYAWLFTTVLHIKLSKCYVYAIPNGNYQIIIKWWSSVLNYYKEPYFQQEVTKIMEYVDTIDVLRATSSRTSENKETLLTTCL
jgi:nitrate/nitrite-specific signal transduction histidine kinase